MRVLWQQVMAKLFIVCQCYQHEAPGVTHARAVMIVRVDAPQPNTDEAPGPLKDYHCLRRE